MSLLITCNMPMYTVCNFVLYLYVFSKNKITKKYHVLEKIRDKFCKKNPLYWYNCITRRTMVLFKA